MRENHPIEGLMLTAMSSIRDMIDVNTIVGEPIEAIEGLLIIPISKVSFGFASGGSEFKEETISEYTKREQEEEIQYKLPFGGGAGAGVSINPVAFLVVQNENVRLIPVEHTSYIDRLLDYVPDLIEKATKFINKGEENKSDKTEKITNKIKKTTKAMSDNEEFEVKEFENRTDTNANVIRNTEMYEPKPESDGEEK